jgi:hypothetical protein
VVSACCWWSLYPGFAGRAAASVRHPPEVFYIETVAFHLGGFDHRRHPAGTASRRMCHLAAVPTRMRSPVELRRSTKTGPSRDGAQVAELTALLPHPEAQLRLTDVEGWRITVFATNMAVGRIRVGGHTYGTGAGTGFGPDSRRLLSLLSASNQNRAPGSVAATMIA